MRDDGDEVFELVDEAGNRVGRARRADCHGNPALLHCVARVLVFGSEGGLLLQKRGADKDIAPGLWDTSAAGHFEPGEAPEAAAHRELAEELGVTDVPLDPVGRFVWVTALEAELAHTFRTTHDGPFDPERREIEDLRMWSPVEIDSALGRGDLAPSFEEEWRRWREGDWQ